MEGIIPTAQGSNPTDKLLIPLGQLLDSFTASFDETDEQNRTKNAELLAFNMPTDVVVGTVYIRRSYDDNTELFALDDASGAAWSQADIKSFYTDLMDPLHPVPPLHMLAKESSIAAPAETSANALSPDSEPFVQLLQTFDSSPNGTIANMILNEYSQQFALIHAHLRRGSSRPSKMPYSAPLANMDPIWLTAPPPSYKPIHFASSSTDDSPALPLEIANHWRQILKEANVAVLAPQLFQTLLDKWMPRHSIVEDRLQNWRMHLRNQALDFYQTARLNLQDG